MTLVLTPYNPSSYGDLTLAVASEYATNEEERLHAVLRFLSERVSSIRTEQERFKAWCMRADALYLAENFTRGGADLWADHPSARVDGRSHVSVNTPAVYVDVPAAIQAVTPIENMLATENTEESREAASMWERVYSAWKAAEDYELKFHKACTVKALYGRTAGKVYWDKKKDRFCVEIIEQPRNLWLGYKNDGYEEVEWAAYVSRMEPNAVIEEFGVDVVTRVRKNDDGSDLIVPFVVGDVEPATASRPWLDFGAARIEVWDYWYRDAVWKDGKFVKMETWNVVFAGNRAVRGPVKYPEYEGEIPYLPLFNTFLPGSPDGRPELYDIEPLIREKFERITSGSQMIAAGTAGDFWQLTGPEAPMRVPDAIKPTRNKVIGVGPGNRIESITPFIAQFQLEQYLGRIDREQAVISGLNDLLLGLAPAQVLSSSKAINALIANYESRLAMRRRLLYKWRRDIWLMGVKIWKKKSNTIRDIARGGDGILDIRDPSLSPRDEMETMTRALNAMNGKIASQRTAMDWIGIDDPETEQDMIREESVDATLWPERVQVMAQLMAALGQLQLQAPPGAQAQAQGQLASGQNDLRTALGAGTPTNDESSQLPGDQGLTPPIPGAPPEAGGAPTPFAQGPAEGLGIAQTMIQGGKAKSRILTQQKY